MKNKMFIIDNDEKIEVSLEGKKEELDKVNELVYQDILSIEQSNINNKGKLFTGFYHIIKQLKNSEITSAELLKLSAIKANVSEKDEIFNKITDSLSVIKKSKIKNIDGYENITDLIKYLRIKDKNNNLREEVVSSVKK